ncbi:hypothetical protein P7L79_12875 [Tistrella mobilis]|uniref:hypothetical protein n=1 Tax=Tistrella mobilis TaxID=171437 RepID=UPI003557F59B
MIRQILLTVTALTLVACAQQPYRYTEPPVDPATAMARYYEEVELRSRAEMRDLATSAAATPSDHFEARTIDRAREAMKDPAAAQIRKVRTVSHGAGGKLVCGEINGKNSYGAYTGFSRFAGTPADVRFEASGGRDARLNAALNGGITDACGPGIEG